jgi:glutamate dehydrogenase/leucine dehydrogenase
MHRAFDDIWNLSKERDLTLRTAAYTIAIERVVKAMKMKGMLL